MRERCARRHSDERRRPEAKLTVNSTRERAGRQHAGNCASGYVWTRVLHTRLLSRLRLLSEDLLHLSMSRHVLVHAPVHAGSFANAQVRLLEQRDALAEALLRHPAATQGCGSANGRESRTHSSRAARLGVSTHLLNISVIASSSCCCAACMADGWLRERPAPRGLAWLRLFGYHPAVPRHALHSPLGILARARSTTHSDTKTCARVTVSL